MEKNKFFENINGNFGFGCMRLPMLDKEVDINQVKDMVDAFMDAGFNYFDTAHVYIDGKSELAIKECLTSRYPRDKYILTNKLTNICFDTLEEVEPLINSQLEACGVEYFDFLLMHAQRKKSFAKYRDLGVYDKIFEMKRQGKIKHVGFSFHDDVQTLKLILDTYPELEVVQIQFNYLDYDDPAIQSGQLMKLLEEYKKAVIIMEPVKGGVLVNLPDEGQKIFDDLKGGSNASYAIRFAADNPQVMMVLSGMSSIEQMKDNISFMKDFKPLTDEERNAINKVCDILKTKNAIPCTGCKYCITENKCAMNIEIPSLFSIYNAKKMHENWDSKTYYDDQTKNGGKANECIECGGCEMVCPQQLNIRDYLKEVSKEFD